ncbi:Hypothetical protein CINCED_3A013469 [Cinara cedri]|uniref:Uncharacterized protein n=1 Tax=Cinara cedri TaxID=506608 RepID=A0A5E4MR82_9HEMI|nr:Hypothetical protein CINCED_3A013469 [Cinara cedri]
MRQGIPKVERHFLERNGGVMVHKCTLTNSWVSNKRGLSSSEWSNAIKASMNSKANRGTFRDGVDGSRYRFQICSENNIKKCYHTSEMPVQIGAIAQFVPSLDPYDNSQYFLPKEVIRSVRGSPFLIE